MSADADGGTGVGTGIMSQERTDRRGALKKLAVGGAVAWATPLILTGEAHASGGTAKCIPKNAGPSPASGFGFTGTVQFTYKDTASDCGKNFRWTGVLNYSYSIPGAGTATCLCGGDARIQVRDRWTICYKSGKTEGCGCESGSDSGSTGTPGSTITGGTWTEICGATTFTKSYTRIVQGNVTGTTGYAAVSVQVRVVCDACGTRKAWNCAEYDGSNSSNLAVLDNNAGVPTAAKSLTFAIQTNPSSTICNDFSGGNALTCPSPC